MDRDPFSTLRHIIPKHDFKVKGKDVASDEDVLVTVAIWHPLVGFTKPVTSLDETYNLSNPEES